jgi:hypothetical protein
MSRIDVIALLVLLGAFVLPLLFSKLARTIVVEMFKHPFRIV